MSYPRIAILLVCVALTTLWSAETLAQPATGKIAGVVHDPGGVPIVGATIEIRNQQTSAVRVLRSSATGAFEVADLPPGAYSVHADLVDAPGRTLYARIPARARKTFVPRDVPAARSRCGSDGHGGRAAGR